MSRINVTFRKIRHRRTAKTFCRKCKKKLTRIVSEEYYDNGFHDIDATRNKAFARMDKEASVLSRRGTLCKKCERMR